MAQEMSIAGDHAYGTFQLAESFQGSVLALAKRCARESRLKVVAGVSRRFNSGARIAMLVLAASSCIIKVSPDGKIIDMDIYTCGDEGEPGPAIKSGARQFKIATHYTHQIKRGNLPESGIKRSANNVGVEPVLNIADMEYSRPITDERMYNVLLSSIKKIVGKENVIAHRHKFDPQGLTGVIGFEYKGILCHVDLHTFPEKGYSSITIVAPPEVADEISKMLEHRLPKVARADMSRHRRSEDIPEMRMAS